MSSFDIISDHSKEKLTEVPRNVLEMTNLKMLFLEGNFLYKLQCDFFTHLPKLMWLDLRNNMLESLPKSIANHQYLENLLLTNNNISKLPNELGLVPNLKALQVADNPITYPVRKVIIEGTKAIKNFLRQQYEKAHPVTKENPEDTEEKLIKVFEESSSFSVNKEISSQKQINELKNTVSLEQPKKELKEMPSQTEEPLLPITKVSEQKLVQPTLRVKKLEHPNKKHEEPMKIIHNVSKSGSKISLKSYFNKPGGKKLNNIPENNLKEGWLNKLRILLNDQERILQQERNLRALADWRSKTRPDTPKTFYDQESAHKRKSAEPPFATYPEYSKTPTREELTSQLQSFLTEANVSDRRLRIAPNLNIEKLINDLVEQLKEMETVYTEMQSPRSEIENAGKQIKTIMEIHKKLIRLKTSNDSIL